MKNFSLMLNLSQYLTISSNKKIIEFKIKILTYIVVFHKKAKLFSMTKPSIWCLLIYFKINLQIEYIMFFSLNMLC